MTTLFIRICGIYMNKHKTNCAQSNKNSKEEMKKRSEIFAIALICCIATLGQSYDQTDQIIVKFKERSSSYGKFFVNQQKLKVNKLNAIVQKHNAIAINQLTTSKENESKLFTIKFPESTNIRQAMNELCQTDIIDYAEPDYKGSAGGEQGVLPNDNYYYRQWALKNSGVFSFTTAIEGADIDMENAWSINQGDSTVIVAIIDSGVKLDHPEFAGRIWINYDELCDNGLDDDNNGYKDDRMGWDFANNDNNPTDDNGHGTNVTGIVGANGNNSIGYAGVDWNCKLMILKATDNTSFGYYSWWASAIYYAVDNGARIINLSLGGTGSSATLQNAIDYALNKNVVVVACMMNTNSETIYYPAAYPGVIAVGSTNPDDTRSCPFYWKPTSGSNYGNHISVVAPGNYIYGLNYQSNSNYNFYWGGTSQATPHVAGIAALLLAQSPSRTAAQIKSIIEQAADDLVGNPSEDTPGWDKYYGHGRVNAFKALSLISDIKSLNSQNQDIQIFPNPSKGNFTVTTNLQVNKIQIFNSLGKLIMTKNMDGALSESFQINQNDVYYIHFTTDRQIVSKKIIVCK